MKKVLKNVLPLARRILEVKYIYPARRKEWAKLRDQNFEHKTKDDLVFFLYGSEYVDQFIFIEGIYEKRFLEQLRGAFDRNAIALDIGANIGNHAIYLHQDFREIHCFEPNPETFMRLDRNVDANGISNIKIYQVALGDSDTVLTFRENLGGNLGNSGFVDESVHSEEDEEDNVRFIPIPVRQADQFVDGLGLSRVDLIKIDVEGFEPKVFNGLRKTIVKHRPLVAFEFHGQSANLGEFKAIADCLPGYGFYELTFSPAEASIRDKLLWYLRHGGKPELKEFLEPESRTYENILAFPTKDAAARFFSRQPKQNR